AASRVFAPIPFARNVGREQDVAHLGLETELVARIGGVGGAIGAGEAIKHGIAPTRAVLLRERVEYSKRRVVAADDLTLARAQMLDVGIADETARAGDDILG